MAETGDKEFTVDDSQLKLPSVQLGKVHVVKDEDEHDVLLKLCVVSRSSSETKGLSTWNSSPARLVFVLSLPFRIGSRV